VRRWFLRAVEGGDPIQPSAEIVRWKSITNGNL
jgi:hypothetical protein